MQNFNMSSFFYCVQTVLFVISFMGFFLKKCKCLFFLYLAHFWLIFILFYFWGGCKHVPWGFKQEEGGAGGLRRPHPSKCCCTRCWLGPDQLR